MSKWKHYSVARTSLICHRPRSTLPPAFTLRALHRPADSAIAIATAYAQGGRVPPALRVEEPEKGNFMRTQALERLWP